MQESKWNAETVPRFFMAGLLLFARISKNLAQAQGEGAQQVRMCGMSVRERLHEQGCLKYAGKMASKDAHSMLTWWQARMQAVC
eukprot:1139667-Pelagomonas_calceolata.AAC.1